MYAAMSRWPGRSSNAVPPRTRATGPDSVKRLATSRESSRVTVRARGLEKAARVIVDQHFAALRDAGEGEDRVDRAAGHDARLRERAVGVGAHHERHLAPVGRGDLLLEEGARGRCQALDTHVLSSRFFAAGNRTLFRISR